MSIRVKTLVKDKFWIVEEKGQKQLWKGVDPGRKQPWETEAWELQPKLAHSFIKNTLKTSIKSIKELDKRF